jgi:septal ring-binding cell division protein DamX
MLARSRALKFASAMAAALMSGGVAWAASGVPVPVVARSHASDDSTTSSTETTEATTTTTVEETTTTTVEEPTDTVDEPTTTVPEKTPASTDDCKPGWGYGDTNHCHSGPPGLSAERRDEKHADEKHADKQHGDEQDGVEQQD